MAQMYPAALDADDFRSRAEHKLYEGLADQLDDAWEVFHSISWLRRTGERGAWEGEIDFVIAHPEAGILCLEVKGGDARLYGGRWQRKENGRWKNYKRDPFVQAQDERHALLRLIADQPGWRERRLLIGHGVSFADVSVAPDGLPPDAPRAIIIDRHDVGRLDDSVRNAIRFFRNGSEPPGPAGLTMLRDCLVPTIEMEVPLAQQFLDEEVQLIELTQEQTLLLRRFGHNRRMCVQ